MKISVVIPALNEERTIGTCIKKAKKSLAELGIEGEVIVADNNSTDSTREVSQQLGARVVIAEQKGYGNAYQAGFVEATGEYIIMGDADDSYNFEEIKPFYQKLEEGFEFVMGNRFRGNIESGAMPWLHRYVGTPFLTGVMNLFFKTGIGDTNCGMRGFRRDALERMGVNAPGMEFATEMVIKASLAGLKISEVPCNLYRDKRDRKPHLRTFRDGWRYLRFMLLFSPAWTFFIPGVILVVLGLFGLITLTLRDVFWPETLLFVSQRHMLSFMVLFILGFQIISLGLAASVFGFSTARRQKSRLIIWLQKYFSLERGMLTGATISFLSVLVLVYLFVSFYWKTLPDVSEILRLDIAVISIAFFILGVQFIYTSFLLGIHYLKIR